jgi:hypothetical protein
MLGVMMLDLMWLVVAVVVVVAVYGEIGQVVSVVCLQGGITSLPLSLRGVVEPLLLRWNL